MHIKNHPEGENLYRNIVRLHTLIATNQVVAKILPVGGGGMLNSIGNLNSSYSKRVEEVDRLRRRLIEKGKATRNKKGKFIK